MTPKKPENIIYRYTFQFDNGEKRHFEVQLDPVTLDLIHAEKKSAPSWADLGFNKCPNCPLSEKTTPRCPAAFSLTDLMDIFRDAISFHEVDVVIETQTRRYAMRTTMQRALSSLIGVYMVTSGCPLMAKLKPMVRYHLPFATLEETKYRAISMYLLSQYLVYKKGGNPDWDLKKLGKIYEDIQKVNISFCKRLANFMPGDANLNALVTLNFFADSISVAIDKDMMKEIETLFGDYLDPSPA